MERIIVTGAVGFIGSHVCRALVEHGYDVLGIDNFDPFYDRRLKEAALRGLGELQHFAFRNTDIRDRQAVMEACEGAHAIVHLAARAGVRPSIEDPELYTSINVQGTTTMLDCARELGTNRFVFGSSSSVYGDDTPVPFSEEAYATTPISPYAATKRAGELLSSVYSHLHGLRIAALRFFTVYGPRQRPDLAIHRFTRLMVAGEPIQQFGDGSTERDYTHVDDIVQGVTSALEWTGGGQGGYEVFNLGESATIRLDRLIELIGDALGTTPQVEVLPPVPGDVKKTCADISKARRVLGYNPEVAIETGIPRFVEWFRQHHGTDPQTAR